MVSFGVRQTLKCTAVTAVLAFAVPFAAAQLDVAAFDEQQRQILERIEQIQSRDGQNSPALLDELRALIALYLENQEHALAIVAIDQAVHVVRVNLGLHSLEQVPLTKQLILSEEARGNHARVWELEQELLTLARRYPDDLRAATVLRDVADRQMEVLERVVDTDEVPPQVIYGCFYDEWPTPEGGDCGAGSRETVVRGMLAEADRNYAAAIGVLLRNETYSSDELRELEMELVRGADLIRTEYEDEGNRGVTGTRMRNPEPVPLAPWATAAEFVEPWRSRLAPLVELADWELPYDSAGTPEDDFLHDLEPHDAHLRSPYFRGRQSLRRLYVYEVVGSSPPVARAAAIVQMADWDLLFSRNGLAVDGYALAHGMLEKAGADEASIAELFAPPLPVVLPSFEPNPLARDETRPTMGHIDVAFAITKYGRADDIEIRGAVNAGESDRDDLIGLLKNSRFRPRFTDGRVADSALVAVRYSLQPSAP